MVPQPMHGAAIALPTGAYMTTHCLTTLFLQHHPCIQSPNSRYASLVLQHNKCEHLTSEGLIAPSSLCISHESCATAPFPGLNLSHRASGNLVAVLFCHTRVICSCQHVHSAAAAAAYTSGTIWHMTVTPTLPLMQTITEASKSQG